MLSRQILLSVLEGSWAQSSLLWWILPPHLDVWATSSPSSITLQPYSWSLDWGSWQFSGVIEVLSSPHLVMVSTILTLQHPLGIMGIMGQNSFTWSECVTLWVCTWLQSLCPTEDEQSLFPCNWSFHLLPWYSHMTEQMFNYLWLGQQLRMRCPVCCPPGHCGHLERISPACMRSWKLLCRTASLSLCPHALCLLVDEWMEIRNSKTEFPCLVNGICLSNKLPWL